MAKFICTKCSYSFVPRNKETKEPPARCPYCSKERCVVSDEDMLNRF